MPTLQFVDRFALMALSLTTTNLWRNDIKNLAKDASRPLPRVIVRPSHIMYVYEDMGLASGFIRSSWLRFFHSRRR